MVSTAPAEAASFPAISSRRELLQKKKTEVFAFDLCLWVMFSLDGLLFEIGTCLNTFYNFVWESIFHYCSV